MPQRERGIILNFVNCDIIVIICINLYLYLSQLNIKLSLMSFCIDVFKKDFDFLPLGLRFNNPGCLRYVSSNRWNGQIGSYKGYAKFDKYDNGVRALTLLSMRYLYSYRLFDVLKFLQRYAPYQDGNFPYKYAHYVQQISGISVINNDIRLLNIELPIVLYAITCVECGSEFMNKSDNDDYRSWFIDLVVDYIDEFLNQCVYPIKGKVLEL